MKAAGYSGTAYLVYLGIKALRSSLSLGCIPTDLSS